MENNEKVYIKWLKYKMITMDKNNEYIAWLDLGIHNKYMKVHIYEYIRIDYTPTHITLAFVITCLHYLPSDLR